MVGSRRLHRQAGRAEADVRRRQALRIRSRATREVHVGHASSCLVRGHEVVEDGFRASFESPECSLATLFSCGGDTVDLPEESGYRAIKPKYLLGRATDRDGIPSLDFEIRPILAEAYNSPSANRFASSAGPDPRLAQQ